MCEGEITVQASESRKIPSESVGGLPRFIRFIKKIFGNTANFFRTDQDLVNFCGNCGNLEIGRQWLRIPSCHRLLIRDAIFGNKITVNGRQKLCDFCDDSMRIKETVEKYKMIPSDHGLAVT